MKTYKLLAKDYPEVIEDSWEQEVLAIPKGTKVTLNHLCNKHNANNRTMWERMNRLIKTGAFQSHTAIVKTDESKRLMRVYVRT